MANIQFDESIQGLLVRIGEVARQRRISVGNTQAQQADLAEISLRAAQNIESGVSGQTAVLFKYLLSLDLLDGLFSAFPDPFSLSPLEELALKQKAVDKRPKRVSRKRSANHLQTSKPVWGDEKE